MDALAGQQDRQGSLAPEGIAPPQGPDLALPGRGPWPPWEALRASAEGCQALGTLLPIARGPSRSRWLWAYRWPAGRSWGSSPRPAGPGRFPVGAVFRWPRGGGGQGVVDFETVIGWAAMESAGFRLLSALLKAGPGFLGKNSRLAERARRLVPNGGWALCFWGCEGGVGDPQGTVGAGLGLGSLRSLRPKPAMAGLPIPLPSPIVLTVSHVSEPAHPSRLGFGATAGLSTVGGTQEGER